MGGPPQLLQRHWNVGNAPRPKPNHGHADKQFLRRRFHQHPGTPTRLLTGTLPVGRILQPILSLAVPSGTLQKQPMHVTARCGGVLRNKYPKQKTIRSTSVAIKHPRDTPALGEDYKRFTYLWVSPTRTSPLGWLKFENHNQSRRSGWRNGERGFAVCR